MKKLALVITIFILVAVPGLSQDSSPRVLSVGGTARIQHNPDLCKLIFDITESADTKAEVRKITEVRIKEINDILKKHDFIDISKITIAPERIDMSRNKRNSNTEYTAIGRQKMEVLLKADEKQINTIYKDLYKIESNIRSRFNYYFSEALMDSLDKVVLKLAIKDAKESAIVIAKETKVELVEIIKIDFNYRMAANRYSSDSIIPASGGRSKGSANPIKVRGKTVNEGIVITWKIK